MEGIETAIAVGGTLTGIVLGHALGGRRDRDARVRDVDRASLQDTRDWLLDILDVLVAAADRDWARARSAGRKLSETRYPRQYIEYIADEAALAELTTILPAAYEQLPRVESNLAQKLAGVRVVVQRAFLEQERELERRGKPRQSTPEQRERLIASAERMRAASKRFTGWRRWYFAAQTVLPW